MTPADAARRARDLRASAAAPGLTPGEREARIAEAREVQALAQCGDVADKHDRTEAME